MTIHSTFTNFKQTNSSIIQYIGTEPQKKSLYNGSSNLIYPFLRIYIKMRGPCRWGYVLNIFITFEIKYLLLCCYRLGGSRGLHMFLHLYDHNHYQFQSLPRFYHGVDIAGNLTVEFTMWQLVIAECLKGLNALLKPIPHQLSFSHRPPDEDRLHMLSIEAIHSLVIT